MRRAIVMVLLSACTEHGKGGGDPTDPTRPPPPASCNCILDQPPSGLEDCCDTRPCFFDEESGEWQIEICDPPPPPPFDPCMQCSSTELCVQSYDGTCNETTACVTRTVDCPDNACSAECEQAYCASPFQCMNRVPCGTESPVAFTCYGP